MNFFAQTVNEFFCSNGFGGKTKGFIKPLALGWVGGV